MNLKFLPVFIRDGWLTSRGRWTLSALGWFMIVVPLWLAYEKLLDGRIAFLFFSVGIALAQIVNYEAKAKQFGIDAPFTSDPTGWRQAKQSYQAQDGGTG